MWQYRSWYDIYFIILYLNSILLNFTCLYEVCNAENRSKCNKYYLKTKYKFIFILTCRYIPVNQLTWTGRQKSTGYNYKWETLLRIARYNDILYRLLRVSFHRLVCSSFLMWFSFHIRSTLNIVYDYCIIVVPWYCSLGNPFFFFFNYKISSLSRWSSLHIWPIRMRI